MMVMEPPDLRWTGAAFEERFAKPTLQRMAWVPCSGCWGQGKWWEQDRDGVWSHDDCPICEGGGYLLTVLP